MDGMKIKDGPRRFLGNQVIKYTRLLPRREGEKPYQGYIVTVEHDEYTASVRYNAHHIAASSITDPWHGIMEGHYGLTKGTADELFREHEQKWG